MTNTIENIKSFQHTPTTVSDFLKRKTRQKNRSHQRLAFDAAARALKDNPYLDGFLWRYDPYFTTGFNCYQLMRNALLETFQVEFLSQIPNIAISYDSHECMIAMGHLEIATPATEIASSVKEAEFVIKSAISINDIDGDFTLVIN